MEHAEVPLLSDAELTGSLNWSWSEKQKHADDRKIGSGAIGAADDYGRTAEIRLVYSFPSELYAIPAV